MELKLGYATPEAVRELFAEYTHMLVAHDPYFQVYLDLQHYDAEVADPDRKSTRLNSSHIEESRMPSSA